MPEASKASVRSRLMSAGADLFSEKGYDGASVRDICERAETSSRMIHHYFGSKRGLFDAILDSFAEALLEVPVRIISQGDATTRAALASRIEIFVAETLHALMENRNVFEIVIRERAAIAAFSNYYEQFTRFFIDAQAKGLARADINPAMISGLVLDRVGNQVIFADAQLELIGKNVFTDENYRREWLVSNTAVFLHGLLSPEPAS